MSPFSMLSPGLPTFVNSNKTTGVTVPMFLSSAAAGRPVVPSLSWSVVCTVPRLFDSESNRSQFTAQDLNVRFQHPSDADDL